MSQRDLEDYWTGYLKIVEIQDRQGSEEEFEAVAESLDGLWYRMSDEEAEEFERRSAEFRATVGEMFHAELTQYWLDRVSKTISEDDSTVFELTRKIQSGAWDEKGAPIIFKDGQVCDGHKRLHAFARAGTPVRCRIRYEFSSK